MFDENKAKEIVEKYVPEKVYLGYVDYSDSLDENPKLLQECVKENGYSQLFPSPCLHRTQ